MGIILPGRVPRSQPYVHNWEKERFTQSPFLLGPPYARKRSPSGGFFQREGRHSRLPSRGLENGLVHFVEHKGVNVGVVCAWGEISTPIRASGAHIQAGEAERRAAVGPVQRESGADLMLSKGCVCVFSTKRAKGPPLPT